MPLIDLNGLGHFKDKENAMIAEDFSASKAYAAGDYCYYNGTLYKFKTAHAAGAWTIADVEAAKLAHDVSDLKESVNDINDFLDFTQSEETAFSGYDDSNSVTATLGNSPFVYRYYSYDLSDAYINKIKLKVLNAGTLSMGVIKRTNAVQGQPYDRNDAIVKATLTIQSTGVQDVVINTPFTVKLDEYLWIGLPSDTCTWVYGNNGIDKGFYYAPSSGTWANSTSSIGINVYVRKINKPSDIRELINSVYKGKTISILGDSISTFAGYIPSGNATYYPSGTVQAVTDTWWKKLIDALEMELEVNNSWSGSRVTTTGGETSAGCGDRAEALGTSPDVIIVWMGINDFNNEVQLGTYDGTTAIPSVTTTFREAYGIMLNKILTKYQSSEVWVCTLPQCERNAESGFPEINGNGVALTQYNKAIKELAEAFGVKVLDHNKCGLTYQNMPTYNPDNLHPNKLGHSLIANNDIRQMDNAVKLRY